MAARWVLWRAANARACEFIRDRETESVFLPYYQVLAPCSRLHLHAGPRLMSTYGERLAAEEVHAAKTKETWKKIVRA